MSGLAVLDGANAELLTRLRDPENGNQDILVALLTTSCLLELSKLVAARLDLPSFAEAAVEVLTQFAPIERCAMHLRPAELPPVRVLVGAFPEQADQALLVALSSGGDLAVPGVQGQPITVDGSPVGYLASGQLPEGLRGANLIEKAAGTISSGLGMLLEGERLRRRAAAGRALEIVSSFGDKYGEEQCNELIVALASFPNAVGAGLLFENRRFGGPIRIVQGSKTDFPTFRSFVVDGRIPLDVEVSWACEPSATEVERLDGILAHLVRSIEKVEQNLRLLEEVETDALTGVGNRRRASRALAAARNRAERRGDPVAVLLLDLDNFKKVNDTLGHDIGDYVLTAFAEHLAATVRGYDTVARWGGEEFVVVCPDTDLAGATALASRIVAGIPAACAVALPDDWDQTVSIGVAVYPHDADNPDALLRAADKALYEAKRSGRNRYSIAAPEAVRR